MSHGNRYDKDDPLIKKPKYFTEAPDIRQLPEYKLIDKLTDKDMEPWIDSKQYTEAHNEANYWEHQLFKDH